MKFEQQGFGQFPGQPSQWVPLRLHHKAFGPSAEAGRLLEQDEEDGEAIITPYSYHRAERALTTVGARYNFKRPATY
jgi:hypothetical protein